jgi:RimJ/RimL family protein N-acetyltransferase
MIRGGKVILRPFSDGFSDGELQAQFRWSKDRDVVRWSNMAPSTLTFTEFVEQLRYQNHVNSPDRQLFAILTAAEGALIGRIGCFNINTESGQAELGVVIGEKAYWSKGYGRDAVCTLLDYVFRNTSLQKIYLYTLKENVRARRSFAFCGFKEVASNKRFAFDGGEYEDVQMEIKREEWLARE